MHKIIVHSYAGSAYIHMEDALTHVSQQISNSQLPACSLFGAIMMMPNLQQHMHEGCQPGTNRCKRLLYVNGT